eukprot:13519-Pelagococcus_subviridis.AAC.1
MNRTDGLYVAHSSGTARSSARPAGAESDDEELGTLGVVAGAATPFTAAASSDSRDARATPPPRRRRLGDGTSDATAKTACARPARDVDARVDAD